MLEALAPFIYGFLFGYFAYPLWTIAKKIWHEAKLARQQWNNPNE
jgi:hypothetical protein